MSQNLCRASLGHFADAADHFLEALQHEPANELAQINEVLAYLLKAEPEIAHAKANELRSRYPSSSQLASHWIASSPASVITETLEQQLTQELKSDPEVSLALSRKALVEINTSKAVAYAESSVKGLPKSSRAHLELARALTGQLIQASKGVPMPELITSGDAIRIEHELDISVDLAHDEEDPRVGSEAFALRADIRLMQNRPEEAEKDANEALRLDADNIQPLLALSHLRSTDSRVDESIELLERAYRKGARPEVAFLYGKALLQRGFETDVDTALPILCGIDVAALRPDMRPHVTLTVVFSLTRRGDIFRAKSYVVDMSSIIKPALANALQCHISNIENDRTSALALVKDALGAFSPGDGPETAEFIADLLIQLENYVDALPLLQDLFNRNVPGFEWGKLLDCAAHLHRDDIVMATCQELQQRGQDPWEVVGFEVNVLQRYSREKAVARLNSFLDTHPGHKFATLARSILAVQSQQPSLVVTDLNALPTVEELSPDSIIPAIHVLRYGAAGNSTVDYAYRFLKLHFADIRAHQALILSLISADPAVTIPPALETVEIGSAVAVHDDLDRSIRWLVIENTDSPNSDFEEIPAHGALATRLLGKRVGESVILAQGKMEDRTGTIAQIMPKYVRRFQDAMGEMQMRFGDKSSIESLRIGATEAETSRTLQKIMDSVKRRETAFVQIRRIYDEHPISLHLFGEQFGENAYIALAVLAQLDGQYVKCCFGTDEERAEAILALQTSAYVVVDLTAIVTIRLLGIEKLLFESKRFRYRMTEGTFNELQETLLGDLFGSTPSATISHQDGVPSMTQRTVEEKAAQRAKDQQFLKDLRTAIEIVPLIKLSALDEARRDPLEKMFGQYGTETLLLASEEDSVLWTEDLIQAQMCRNEFGVKRTWTELIIEQAAVAGEIEPEEKLRCGATLVALEYLAVLFDGTMMLKAVEMADGLSWRTPLKQFVRVFERPAGNPLGLLGVFIDFILRLYRENYLPETRCRITEAFLDALWANIALRKHILQFRRTSSAMFGLNKVGQQSFAGCFDTWFVKKQDHIIGL